MGLCKQKPLHPKFQLFLAYKTNIKGKYCTGQILKHLEVSSPFNMHDVTNLGKHDQKRWSMIARHHKCVQMYTRQTLEWLYDYLWQQHILFIYLFWDFYLFQPHLGLYGEFPIWRALIMQKEPFCSIDHLSDDMITHYILYRRMIKMWWIWLHFNVIILFPKHQRDQWHLWSKYYQKNYQKVIITFEKVPKNRLHWSTCMGFANSPT